MGGPRKPPLRVFATTKSFFQLPLALGYREQNIFLSLFRKAACVKLPNLITEVGLQSRTGVRANLTASNVAERGGLWGCGSGL